MVFIAKCVGVKLIHSLSNDSVFFFSEVQAPALEHQTLLNMYQVEGTVPSVVIDAGSHTLKGGTAGEDLPHILIPSVLARELETSESEQGSTKPKYKKTSAGEYSVKVRRDNVDVATPFGSDGLVENWDLFETLLGHTLRNEMRVETRENALLFAEPNHNGRKARERIAEMIFEKFEVPAVYLARTAVLAAYANGRTTGIVLDVGYSGTSAVPVEDGAIVKNKFIRSAAGGRALNDALSAHLRKESIKLRPLWSYKRTITGTEGMDEDTMVRKSKIEELSFPSTTSSFEKYSYMGLLEEVKASLCVVHENPSIDLTSLPVASDIFELPDGNTIEMGKERFALTENTLFSNLPHISTETSLDTRLSYVNQFMSGSRQNGGSANQPKHSDGLAGLVIDAIRLCDASVHRDMYAGVCLTGGTSDMGGLFERLSFGLLAKYHKVRVLAATGSHERKYCAWTGGSILATFSEFQKMWFSRSEYDENGSSFVHRKCQ